MVGERKMEMKDESYEKKDGKKIDDAKQGREGISAPDLETNSSKTVRLCVCPAVTFLSP